MIELLNKLKQNKELCEIYFYDQEADRFCAGYIVAFDKKFVLIKSVGYYGEDDGWTCKLIEDIATIQTQTEHIAQIKVLSEHYKTAYKNFPVKGDDLLSGVLTAVKEKDLICTVTLDNDNDRYICGKIKPVSDGVVEIGVLKYNGQNDGTAAVIYDDITCVDVETKDEQRTRILIDCGFAE